MTTPLTVAHDIDVLRLPEVLIHIFTYAIRRTDVEIADRHRRSRTMARLVPAASEFQFNATAKAIRATSRMWRDTMDQWMHTLTYYVNMYRHRDTQRWVESDTVRHVMTLPFMYKVNVHLVFLDGEMQRSAAVLAIEDPDASLSTIERIVDAKTPFHVEYYGPEHPILQCGHEWRHVNLSHGDGLKRAENFHSHTEVHVAAEMGRRDVLSMLHRRGIDGRAFTAPTLSRRTPLHIAVIANQAPCVRFLLARDDVTPLACDKAHMSVVAHAVRATRRDGTDMHAVWRLIMHCRGDGMAQRVFNDALTEAVYYRKPAVVRALLARDTHCDVDAVRVTMTRRMWGADFWNKPLDAYDTVEMPLWHFAAFRRAPDSLRALLPYVADVDHRWRDARGGSVTALHVAALVDKNTAPPRGVKRTETTQCLLTEARCDREACVEAPWRVYFDIGIQVVEDGWTYRDIERDEW